MSSKNKSSVLVQMNVVSGIFLKVGAIRRMIQSGKADFSSEIPSQSSGIRINIIGSVSVYR